MRWRFETRHNSARLDLSDRRIQSWADWRPLAFFILDFNALPRSCSIAVTSAERSSFPFQFRKEDANNSTEIAIFDICARTGIYLRHSTQLMQQPNTHLALNFVSIVSTRNYIKIKNTYVSSQLRNDPVLKLCKLKTCSVVLFNYDFNTIRSQRKWPPRKKWTNCFGVEYICNATRTELIRMGDSRSCRLLLFLWACSSELSSEYACFPRNSFRENCSFCDKLGYNCMSSLVVTLSKCLCVFYHLLRLINNGICFKFTLCRLYVLYSMLARICKAKNHITLERQYERTTSVAAATASADQQTANDTPILTSNAKW